MRGHERTHGLGCCCCCCCTSLLVSEILFTYQRKNNEFGSKTSLSCVFTRHLKRRDFQAASDQYEINGT